MTTIPVSFAPHTITPDDDDDGISQKNFVRPRQQIARSIVDTSSLLTKSKKKRKVSGTASSLYYVYISSFVCGHRKYFYFFRVSCSSYNATNHVILTRKKKFF